MATNPTATSFTNIDGAHNMGCDGAGKFAQNRTFYNPCLSVFYHDENHFKPQGS